MILHGQKHTLFVDIVDIGFRALMANNVPLEIDCLASHKDGFGDLLPDKKPRRCFIDPSPLGWEANDLSRFYLFRPKW